MDPHVCVCVCVCVSLLKCPNCLNRSSVLSEDPVLWTMSSELMDPCGNQPIDVLV